MENEKKEKKMLDNFYDRAGSYGVTKKTMYALISVVAMIAIVFVLSFTQAGFDASQLKEISYWINFAILAGLSVYGMVCGTQIGDDTARNNPKGAFRANLVKYKTIYDKIDENGNFAFFEDWLEFYRLRKLEKARRDFLLDNGVKQQEVLDLDIEDLPMLKKAFRKDWTNTHAEGKYKNNETFFVTYTEEQILAIKACLEGKIKVAKLPSSFFKSVYAQDSKDMWNSAIYADAKKKLFLLSNYSFKIVLMLGSSLILNGMTSAWKGDIDWSQTLLKFFSTIGNIVMSLVLGIYIGYAVVKIDLTYLEFKSTILKLYIDELNSKIFIPKTIDEKARDEYEKLQGEEEENEQETILE